MEWVVGLRNADRGLRNKQKKGKGLGPEASATFNFVVFMADQNIFQRFACCVDIVGTGGVTSMFSTRPIRASTFGNPKSTTRSLPAHVRGCVEYSANELEEITKNSKLAFPQLSC